MSNAYDQKTIEITLQRSPISVTPNQKKNLLGLGLSYREQSVFRQDTPALRGMLRKVIHLVGVSRATRDQKELPNHLSMQDMVEIIPPTNLPKKTTPGSKVEMKKKAELPKKATRKRTGTTARGPERKGSQRTKKEK